MITREEKMILERNFYFESQFYLFVLSQSLILAQTSLEHTTEGWPLPPKCWVTNNRAFQCLSLQFYIMFLQWLFVIHINSHTASNFISPPCRIPLVFVPFISLTKLDKTTASVGSQTQVHYQTNEDLRPWTSDPPQPRDLTSTLVLPTLPSTLLTPHPPIPRSHTSLSPQCIFNLPLCLWILPWVYSLSKVFNFLLIFLLPLPPLPRCIGYLLLHNKSAPNLAN